MKMSAKCIAGIIVVLVIAASCATGGTTQQGSSQQGGSPQQGNEAAGNNPWVGLWEGKDPKGDIYSFYFTNTEWESYIESSGITVPFYKGTYTFTSTRVNLQVTDEVDTSTMKWMPHTDNFPPITGRLSGSVLSLPTFTDADLIKE